MIRHMDDESVNWKDFERALKNSKQFAYHTAGGSCFFGFIGAPGWADGWAGAPSFQNLIADYHTARKSRKSDLCFGLLITLHYN